MTTLSRTLTIKNGETDVKLDMSHGMLLELMRVTGASDADVVARLPIDVFSRDLVIRRLLTVDLRKPMEELDQLVSSFDIDISADDADAVMAWTQEHMLDFFVRATRNIQKVEAKLKEMTS